MKIIVLFCSICCINLAAAQSEPEDIQFYSEDPVWINSEDSVMFPVDLYNSLLVDFDLSDTAHFGKLHIELAMNDYLTIVAKYDFSMSELIQNSLIAGDHISLVLGNHQKESAYLLSITIEKSSGALLPTITKVLSL